MSILGKMIWVVLENFNEHFYFVLYRSLDSKSRKIWITWLVLIGLTKYNDEDFIG